MEQQRSAVAGGRSPARDPAAGGEATVTVGSAAVIGDHAQPVTVEVSVTPNALGGFTEAGYGLNATREPRDRLRAALITSGLTWPEGAISVTVSPHVRSSRGQAALDLPIAMALLAADGQIPADRVTDRMFLGELGLDGSIRPVEHAFELAGALRGAEVVVPVESLPEARAAATLVGDIVVRASYNLNTLLALDPQRPSPTLAHARREAEPRQPLADRAGDRYLSEVHGTVYESLGDGRYAVVDGPHSVPSQVPLGTVVTAGRPLDTWAPLGTMSGDPAGDPVHLAARPFLRQAGVGPTPPGWVVESTGRWATEVVYDPRRHEVAITWQTKPTGTAAVLESTGWERLAVDGPRTFWTRDRHAATRAALDRHDRSVIAGTEVARQPHSAASADVPEPPGL